MYPRSRPQVAYPPLDEADTESAISKLTRGTLGTLGYVGSTLDKLTGARAIRGALGGKPRELLSVIPGSDVVGATKEEDTVHGEDLLRSLGYDPSQGNWAERNLVGPGLEIALDPATYAGGIGALTKLGKGAAKTGTGTKGLLASVKAGERSIHPLAAMAERVVPGSQKAAVAGLEGAGRLAGKVNVGVRRISPTLAAVEDRLVAPVARKAELVRRSLFDPASGPVPEELMQAEHREMFPKRQAAMQAIDEREIDLRTHLQQVMKETGLTQPQAYRFIRQMAEKVPTSLPEGQASPRLGSEAVDILGQLKESIGAEGVPGFIGPSYQPHLLERLGHEVHPDLYAHGPSRVPALEGLVREVTDIGRDEPRAAELAAGVKSAALQDPRIDYLMRQRTKTKGGGPGFLGGTKTKPFGTQHPSFLRREKALTDWLGGTTAIGDLMTANLAGANRSWGRKQINEYLLADQLGRLAAQGSTQIGPEELARITRNAVGMQRLLRGVPKANVLGVPTGDLLDRLGHLPGAAQASTLGRVTDALPEATPYFDPDPIRAATVRAKRAIKSTTGADAQIGMIRRSAPLAQGLETDVPVPEVLRRAKMDTDVGVRRALRAVGVTPEAEASFLEARRQALGPGFPEQAPPVLDEGRALRDLLRQYNMPAEQAAAATRSITGWQLPEALKPVVGGLDALQNWWKTGVYSLWPASLGRNIGTGYEENLIEAGMWPWNPMYGRAAKIRAGVPVQTGIPEFEHLTPEAQRHALLREAYPRGIIGGVQGDISERVGAVGSGKFRLQAGAPDPLGAVSGYGDLARQMGTSLRTKGLKGLGDVPTIMRAAGNLAEERLRLPEYMHLRATGHTPDVARSVVKRTHFEYPALTDFEQNVMKRIAPFYTYSRFNLPKQVQRAVQRPGVVGGPIRFSGVNQQEGEYVPEYLRSGLALPLGSDVVGPGTARYLSSLGLPVEEALGRLKIGQTPQETLGKTAESFLGLLRPELRMALEGATGRQFFTGRDLADLHVGKVESLGGLLDEDSGRLAAQLITGTPFSRAVSTANRVLDERKYAGGPVHAAVSLGIPLLSGVRISDVDLEKWRAIDARNQLERELAASPNIRTSKDYYADKKARAAGEITPEEAFALRLNAALKQRAREANEQQKRVGVRVGG
jgi:hypothetical protein